MTLPAPPISADADVPDGFVLDAMRLLGSELAALATPEEFRAAVLLWCRAWQQRPAGSLPANDKVLASYVGAPLGRFLKIRAMALRNFYRCSDDRLYHPVLVKDALRSWKALQQRRTAWAKGKASDRSANTSAQPSDDRSADRSTVPALPYLTLPDLKKASVLRTASAEAPAPVVDNLEIPLFLRKPPDGDWKALLFGEGRDWLMQAAGISDRSARAFIGQCRAAAGEDDARVYRKFAEAQAGEKADPKAWITAQLGGNGHARRDEKRPPTRHDEIIGKAHVVDGVLRWVVEAVADPAELERGDPGEVPGSDGTPEP